MTDAPAPVRPMTPGDYKAGSPVRQPVAAGGDHPTRDLLVGAIVGAAALWFVPKLLDRYVGGLFGDDGEEFDLEDAP